MSTALSDLSKNWDKLSYDYRPSAFWFWNGLMQPEHIRQSISQMVDAGIREVIIHPIHGLELEYMSDVYLERLFMVLELFRQKDTKVWIYDDYGWPSGNVGGRLIEKYPQFRGWYLKFERNDDGTVKAKPTLSAMVMDNAMGASWTNHCPGQLDTLSYDAVRCFIDMTHERIYEKCKAFFGSTIVGFFTDEPAAMVPNGEKGDSFWNVAGLPWTPRLPELFELKFGYSIESRYAELASSQPSQLKQDYWQLIKQLHSEAYHGQIGTWCRKHGVKYTGHLGEDNLLQQVRFAGSVYECLKYMDVPGVDQLSCVPETEDRFIEQVLISSVTRHCGKSRSFCEAWGVSPLDLRLSKMYDQASMLALHGINDIAIMGFHQDYEGINKYTYWPLMFKTSPWWGWFKEFGNAFARTVSLISLGRRCARYAVLYPQCRLEQESIFTGIYGHKDVSSRVIDELGRGIYAAGETFDFVFPEILSQAKVIGGKICFDNAQYDAILSPSELSVDSNSGKILEVLGNSGAVIYDGGLRDILDLIKTAADDKDFSAVHNGNAGDVRIFKIDYSDGRLIGLRNVKDQPIELNIISSKFLTEWDPLSGTGKACLSKYSLNPHTTLLISLTDYELVSNGMNMADKAKVTIETDWRVATESANLLSLDDLQFKDSDGRWHAAVSLPLPTMSGDSFYEISIPGAFRGYTSIPFKGIFKCGSLPKNIGLIYESKHLGSVEINGTHLSLEKSYTSVIWDDSCKRIDIADLCIKGSNVVSGELLFQKYQTSVDGDVFYGFWKPMPSCDVFVCGDFRVDTDRVINEGNPLLSLPVNFDRTGLPQYHGVVRLSADIQITAELAGRILGIEVEPIDDDAIEVLINGVSLGRKVAAPYNYMTPEILPERTKIQIRIAGTTASLSCQGKDWGINKVKWILCRPINT